MATPATPLDRIHALPCWSGPVAPEPLPGGMTNKNYVVTDRAQKFVVRLGQDLPVHGVLRSNELTASRAAHAAGLSPEVVYAADGVLVLRYIEGRTLTAEMLRSAAVLPAIVDLVRRCHEQLPQHLDAPALMFWVFHVVRGYATALRRRASAYVPLLPGLMERAARLEQDVGPIEIVFGHNDLLAANFIDDGQRLWLIDWDYAGFNSPLFDLGGLVSNNELDAAQTGFVLARYCGTVDTALMRRFGAMKCASLLREAMWSMVSELDPPVPFDYAGYTATNLARFENAYHAFIEGTGRIAR